jgi:hypothetical protein
VSGARPRDHVGWPYHTAWLIPDSVSQLRRCYHQLQRRSRAGRARFPTTQHYVQRDRLAKFQCGRFSAPAQRSCRMYIWPHIQLLAGQMIGSVARWADADTSVSSFLLWQPVLGTASGESASGFTALSMFYNNNNNNAAVHVLQQQQTSCSDHSDAFS